MNNFWIKEYKNSFLLALIRPIVRLEDFLTRIFTESYINRLVTSFLSKTRVCFSNSVIVKLSEINVPESALKNFLAGSKITSELIKIINKFWNKLKQSCFKSRLYNFSARMGNLFSQGHLSFIGWLIIYTTVFNALLLFIGDSDCDFSKYFYRISWLLLGLLIVLNSSWIEDTKENSLFYKLWFKPKK